METMQTVIGESHALNTALDHISNLAGIDRSILVTGERGTGKEIAAAISLPVPRLSLIHI